MSDAFNQDAALKGAAKILDAILPPGSRFVLVTIDDENQLDVRTSLDTLTAAKQTERAANRLKTLNARIAR